MQNAHGHTYGMEMIFAISKNNNLFERVISHSFNGNCCRKFFRIIDISIGIDLIISNGSQLEQLNSSFVALAFFDFKRGIIQIYCWSSIFASIEFFLHFKIGLRAAELEREKNESHRIVNK